MWWDNIMADRVTTAVLKEKVVNIEKVFSRIDDAIVKIVEVNNNVSKMLAVHETRLIQQEQQREILHQRITDFKKEMMDEIRSLRDENTRQHRDLETRIDKIEKWRWFVVGVASVIGFLIAQMANISHLFS